MGGIGEELRQKICQKIHKNNKTICYMETRYLNVKVIILFILYKYFSLKKTKSQKAINQKVVSFIKFYFEINFRTYFVDRILSSRNVRNGMEVSKLIISIFEEKLEMCSKLKAFPRWNQIRGDILKSSFYGGRWM